MEKRHKAEKSPERNFSLVHRVCKNVAHDDRKHSRAHTFKKSVQRRLPPSARCEHSGKIRRPRRKGDAAQRKHNKKRKKSKCQNKSGLKLHLFDNLAPFCKDCVLFLCGFLNIIVNQVQVLYSDRACHRLRLRIHRNCKVNRAHKLLRFL